MYKFPIKSPRWIWIAVLTCLFVVYVFPLHDIKCATGQWKVYNTINKNYTCRSCPTCPSGYGLAIKCDTVVTQEAPSACVKCVSGVNHSSGDDQKQCQPCRTCLEHEIVNGKCSSEEDATTCSGICEKGYTMNNEKTRCVRLNIVGAGDNITNFTDVPVHVHTTPSTKTDKLSGIAIALIAVSCLAATLGVACCYKYKQSHSHNQASENEVELSDSSERTPNTCRCNIKEERVALIISDENNGQLQSPNFPDTSPSLGSTPQQTPPTDSQLIEATTTEMENETSEAVPINNNTCETPCLDVDPKTTTRDENRKFSAASPPSLSTPSHTPPPCRRSPRSRRPTKIGDLNENDYAEVCESLNLNRPGKDWRTMAGKMGYPNKRVRYFEEFKKDNPTDAVLRDWSTKDGNDVYKLITICKDIGRDDVVTILEVALGIRRQSGVEEVGN